ncbi:3-ketoacyl-CoA thiolase 2, peroxisomal [Tanacetum coccineum]
MPSSEYTNDHSYLWHRSLQLVIVLLTKGVLFLGTIAYRTPLCKSKRGGLKDTYPDDILAPVLKAVIEKTNLNTAEVGDMVVGSVLGADSQRAIECRMAAFYASFPVTDVAAAIKAGFYDIGIGAGWNQDQAAVAVVSHLKVVLATAFGNLRRDHSVKTKVKTMAQAQDCLLPMRITLENVSQRFGVKRKEQDQAAVDSNRKQLMQLPLVNLRMRSFLSRLREKIVNLKIREETRVTISIDDGIRPGTTLADLAKLKPVFNCPLDEEKSCFAKGITNSWCIQTFAAVGVPPAIMGIGPAVAIPAAVNAAGLEVNDIDLFEINEAFASQFLYCQKKLETDPQKINVNGGAMTSGHPLGATCNYQSTHPFSTAVNMLVLWSNERPLENKALNVIIGAWFTLWQD